MEPWLPPSTQTHCPGSPRVPAQEPGCGEAPRALAVDVRCPFLPPQAPDPQGPEISPAETFLSWTQTARQGTTGRHLTSSSSRNQQRGRPPHARRVKMRASLQKRRRRRLWTLWASCGRCPVLGGPPSGWFQAPWGWFLPPGSLRKALSCLCHHPVWPGVLGDWPSAHPARCLCLWG